jgi:hypothetical protein
MRNKSCFKIKHLVLGYGLLIIVQFASSHSFAEQYTIIDDEFSDKAVEMPDGSRRAYPNPRTWAFTFRPDMTWPTNYGNGTNWLESNGECQTYVTPFLGAVKGRAIPFELRYNPFEVKPDGLHIRAALLTPEQLSYYKIGGFRRFGSGMLLSRQSFTYGHVSMVAKLPSARGSWPALWLLSSGHEWPPEIDIFEGMVWAKHNEQIHSGYLEPKMNGNGQGYTKWFDLGVDPSKGFHEYSMDWTAKTLTISFDGKPVIQKPTPPSLHRSMYLIVNLAVGGKWPYNELEVEPINDRSSTRLSKGSDLIQDDYPADMVIRSIKVTSE